MLDYSTITEARTHLKEAYDRASRGTAVRLGRDQDRLVLTNQDRLRRYFASTVSPRLRVGQDDGRWIASMDARPFVAEGADAESAIDELTTELREYAEDYEEHYSGASNHQNDWGLVQLVQLSTDAELAEWVRSEA